MTIFTFGFHLFFFAENKPHLYIYLGFRLFEIQFQLNTHYIYNGFQETCHHGSENFFFYLFPFSENGISQLSTSLRRVVLQNSISYKHPQVRPPGKVPVSGPGLRLWTNETTPDRVFLEEGNCETTPDRFFLDQGHFETTPDRGFWTEGRDRTGLHRLWRPVSHFFQKKLVIKDYVPGDKRLRRPTKTSGTGWWTSSSSYFNSWSHDDPSPVWQITLES